MSTLTTTLIGMTLPQVKTMVIVCNNKPECDCEEGGDVAEDLRALVGVFGCDMRQDEAQRCEEPHSKHLKDATVTKKV